VAVGRALLDFGTWPGSSMASTTVIGQLGIQATSLLSASISLWAATPDHSIDEHRVEAIRITAGNIVEGDGFTIYGECMTALAYGQFLVDWVWS
jgi:hypothetical protein